MKAEPINIIGAPEDWPVVASDPGGPLVKVQIGPHSFVRMREAEARARGLLPPEEKAEPPARNKARKPRANKAAT